MVLNPAGEPATTIGRLDTERLDLRPMAADDAVALYELDSDPAVMRSTLHGRPSTLDEVQFQEGEVEYELRRPDTDVR
jgi:hypothetical protein